MTQGKKIVGELSVPENEVRKNFWTEMFKTEVDLEFEWRSLPPELISDPVNELKAMKDWSAFLIAPIFSKQIMIPWPKIPEEVIEAGLTDAAIKQQGQWWFRCFLKQALIEMIVKKAPQLDTHQQVYVTGSDTMAHMCVTAAIQMGFKKIAVVAREAEDAQAIIADLQKRFFGINLMYIRDSELTLQPNNGSLLLNTIDSESGEAILDDLPYMNFLDHGGLVVDLAYPNSVKALVEEAEHVGVLHLDGFEVIAYRDFLFLKSVFEAKFKTPFSEYLEKWKLFLSTQVPQQS